MRPIPSEATMPEVCPRGVVVPGTKEPTGSETHMSPRPNPTQHNKERSRLAEMLREEEQALQGEPISYGVMPLGPDDIRALAKATGYSVEAVKALARVYQSGGLKAAGGAALTEAMRIAGAGWKSASDKAQKLRSMLTDFHRAVKRITPELAQERWPVTEPPAAPPSKLHKPGQRVTENTPVPSMSRVERRTQDKAIVEEAQRRIGQLSEPAGSKSGLLNARKPSARAQAMRQERAMAKRDAALEELKSVRALGVRGDLPGRSDALARPSIEITPTLADNIEAPETHRAPFMSEEEFERLANDPGRSYAHHPETVVDRSSGGKTSSTGDSFDNDAIAREAGARQRAKTQMRMQEKAIKRSLPKPPKSPKK
jgi:hypothetical protein